MWRQASYGWQPEPALTVHVSAGTGAAPQQLSWVRENGTECSIAFAPDMTTCYGHRRMASAHVEQIRGELDRRESLPQAGDFHGYVFDAEVMDGQWQPSPRLRLLVDDGSEAGPRWVAWRDQLGTAYSAGLWSRVWSSEPDHMVVAGLRVAFVGAEFHGYRQLAGQAPAAYRGVLVDSRDLVPHIVSEVESP